MKVSSLGVLQLFLTVLHQAAGFSTLPGEDPPDLGFSNEDPPEYTIGEQTVDGPKATLAQHL